MDPLTQGLLGAVASQTVTAKKLGSKAWLVGLLAGMAADLDVLIYSNVDPLLPLIYHRHFTHSLAFIPIGGVLLALLFLIAFKRYRPYWRWVILASVIAYATHGLLDACTSYGTLLYWPFSNERIAWDIISIIDPRFTLVLLLGVIATVILDTANAARYALLIALLYLGLGAWQHHRAQFVQQKIIHSRGHSMVKARVMPDFASITKWRSLYASQDRLYIDGISNPWLMPPRVNSGPSIPWYRLDLLPLSIKKNPSLYRDFKVFYWFSDEFTSAFVKQPLTIVDMRYLLSYEPLIAFWGIYFPSTSVKHVTRLTRILKEQ